MTANAWVSAATAQPFTCYHLACKNYPARNDTAEHELRGVYYRDAAGKWRDAVNHSPVLLMVTHVRRSNLCKRSDEKLRANLFESAYRL